MHATNRRQFLASLAALACTRAVAGGGERIPQSERCRVIVDNDFAGDPDGLVALAHQWLSPSARTVLVTASSLNPEFAPPSLQGHGAHDGVHKAIELAARLPRRPTSPILPGRERVGDEASPDTPAARAIVAEALRDDPLPLFLTCGGPLTNVADALRLEPAIAERCTLIWIGGGPEPDGGWEYNLNTDLAAARAVIERSTIPLWTVPVTAYRQMQFSLARAEIDLHRSGPLGAWLYAQFTHPPSFVRIGGTWPFGDTPLVLLTSLSDESSRYHERAARRLLDDGRYGPPIDDRRVRVYDTLDVELAFTDLIARVRLAHGG